MRICEYGCEREAKYHFPTARNNKGKRVGKWCCSKTQNSCLGMRKINSKATKGRIFSKETIKKLSESHKGEKNYLYGKKLPEKTRRKISKSQKQQWKSPAWNEEERRRKISKAHKGRTNYWILGDKNPNKRLKFRKKMSERMKGENNPKWKGGLPKCIDCRKQLSRHDAKRCKKCSLNKFFIRTGNKHPNWNPNRAQVYAPYTEKHFMKEIRQRILEEQNGKCGYCRTGDSRFNFHHIDYNKQNDERYNKIFLCDSCHSKTNGSTENRNHWKEKLENLNILYIRGSGLGITI